MLKIKLKRIGRKNNIFYKIIATENLYSFNKKNIIELGFYNTITKIIKLNLKLLHKLLSCGAYPTNSVRKLIYKII